MPGIRVRVTLAPRAPDFSATDDDVFGEGLLAKVLRAVVRSPPPPAALLLRADSVQIVYLAPLLDATRDPHRVIASLAGLPGVEAVAVLGRFVQRQRQGPVRRLAGVFIEWTDGRWWASWRPITEEGRLIPTDEYEVLRAADGAPRPGGLGGWFSRARFHELRADFEPVAPVVPREETIN